MYFYSSSSYFYFTGYSITISYSLLNISGVPPSTGDGVTEYPLSRNYPHPFNPGTTLKYELRKTSHVTLALFNSPGQLVSTLANGNEEAGYPAVKIDGTGMASGVYFYRIQGGIPHYPKSGFPEPDATSAHLRDDFSRFALTVDPLMSSLTESYRPVL